MSSVSTPMEDMKEQRLQEELNCDQSKQWPQVIPLSVLKLRWPFHPCGKRAEPLPLHTNQSLDTYSSLGGGLALDIQLWLDFSCQHCQQLGEIRTSVLKETSKWHIITPPTLRVIYVLKQLLSESIFNFRC